MIPSICFILSISHHSHCSLCFQTCHILLIKVGGRLSSAWGAVVNSLTFSPPCFTLFLTFFSKHLIPFLTLFPAWGEQEAWQGSRMGSQRADYCPPPTRIYSTIVDYCLTTRIYSTIAIVNDSNSKLSPASSRIYSTIVNYCLPPTRIYSIVVNKSQLFHSLKYIAQHCS